MLRDIAVPTLVTVTIKEEWKQFAEMQEAREDFVAEKDLQQEEEEGEAGAMAVEDPAASEGAYLDFGVSEEGGDHTISFAVSPKGHH